MQASTPDMHPVAPLARGVHFFYQLCIAPRSSTEERRRRERILNIILVAMIGFLLTLNGFVYACVIIYRNEYRGIPFGMFSMIVLLFTLLLFLSRKGYIRLASDIFIGLFFILATYGAYRWGVELPMVALSYVIIIVTSSILVNARFGFIMTMIISATLVAIGYLQVYGIIAVQSYWKQEPITIRDPIELSAGLLFMMSISWLFDTEIRTSLAKARQSEQLLMHERDLLEIKVEERTRELKTIQAEKLSNLYRFAEFGRLSAGLFHDLMTPLTAIIGTVENLKSSPEKISELELYLQKAVTNSRRMGALIASARKQTATTAIDQVFAMDKELDEAIDILQYRAREASTVIRVRTKKKLSTYGNPLKFHQVAVNLISNAIDATETATKGNRTITVELDRKGGKALFVVRDNGIGIPSELHQRVFDPFFTTKQSKGMGLGLSTTKDIIERHFNGAIHITSIEGKGTTILVRIPLAFHDTTTTPPSLPGHQEPAI